MLFCIAINCSWISSVNKLLDNLDTNVGDVVENQVGELYDYDNKYNNNSYDGDDLLDDDENEHATEHDRGGGGGGEMIDGIDGESPVDDILAKRGLLNDDEEDQEEDQEDQEESNETNDEQINHGDVIENEENNTQYHDDDIDDDDIDDDDDDGDDGNNNAKNREEEEVQCDQDGNDDDAMGAEIDNDNDNDGNGDDKNNDIDTTAAPLPSSLPSSLPTPTPTLSEEELNAAGKTVTPVPLTVPPPPSTSPNQQNNNNNNNDQIIIALKKQLEHHKQLVTKMKKETTTTNKETRKLRRTVVKLNAQLDSAEHELDAQRTELERAAVRMEKERQRYKDDKERLGQSNKEDMKAVMEEHKTSVDAMVTSHAEQMIDMEERIKRAEEARAKEGGDMSMELVESAERERESLKKAISLEEEKATMTSQIASLNTQMTALQSRVESLHEAAEVASEQEREADDRLDAALSLHARQLGQRQAREAQLERTVADIAAALVVARQREAQHMNGTKVVTGQSDEDAVQLKEKLVAAEDEIEIFKAQLMIERQKSETLQKELEEISMERTQELSSNLARHKQYDRRVSDLSVEVTQLQSKLRSFDHDASFRNAKDDGQDDTVSRFKLKENECKKQIASLSEDLLRLRGRLDNSSTEVLTLRNRLRAALNRAEIAEKELKVAASVTESSYDVERGSLSHNYGSRSRRRFGGRPKKSATIRSVLRLDAGGNETLEAIGGGLDSLDLTTIKSLNYMRSDPFARIFFLLYLGFLHMWVFCLLAFHAHGTLEPALNVGLEQLLKHSYRHNEQVHGNHP